MAQPMPWAMNPAGTPAAMRVTAMKPVRSAYCVAVYRLSHRLIRNAMKPALPIPPQTFSKPMEATMRG